MESTGLIEFFCPSPVGTNNFQLTFNNFQFLSSALPEIFNGLQEIPPVNVLRM